MTEQIEPLVIKIHGDPETPFWRYVHWRILGERAHCRYLRWREGRKIAAWRRECGL